MPDIQHEIDKMTRFVEGLNEPDNIPVCSWTRDTWAAVLRYAMIGYLVETAEPTEEIQEPAATPYLWRTWDEGGECYEWSEKPYYDAHEGTWLHPDFGVAGTALDCRYVVELEREAGGPAAIEAIS